MEEEKNVGKRAEESGRRTSERENMENAEKEKVGEREISRKDDGSDREREREGRKVKDESEK